MSSLLRPEGFYSESSARTAYTTCGSLIRYTERHHGLETVKSWYRTGEWSGPVSLDGTFLEGWRTFLNEVPLDPKSITAAQAYFDRPSIFRRVCAHEISSLREEEIRRASRQNDHTRALTLMNTLLTFSPNDRWTLMRRLEHYSLQQDLSAARAEASLRLNTHPKIGQLSRNLATEWLADLDVLSGHFASAQKRIALYSRRRSAKRGLGDLRLNRSQPNDRAVPKASSNFLVLVKIESLQNTRFKRYIAHSPMIKTFNI